MTRREYTLMGCRAQGWDAGTVQRSRVRQGGRGRRDSRPRSWCCPRRKGSWGRVGRGGLAGGVPVQRPVAQACSGTQSTDTACPAGLHARPRSTRLPATEELRPPGSAQARQDPPPPPVDLNPRGAAASPAGLAGHAPWALSEGPDSVQEFPGFADANCRSRNHSLRTTALSNARDRDRDRPSAYQEHKTGELVTGWWSPVPKLAKSRGAGFYFPTHVHSSVSESPPLLRLLPRRVVTARHGLLPGADLPGRRAGSRQQGAGGVPGRARGPVTLPVLTAGAATSWCVALGKSHCLSLRSPSA
ncbi:uncharacterized protein [Dasypus novemcinctus]|uniref:uncharacterized protein n=1 Tax=Dasypus novemcinctus TaxID=9361 RepID=UPI00265D7724|nr:uncharacterized protein LOC131278160 [Dasypus novemcinctus]XP_058150959.1 uncharacterized protein LOC131278160 [Dasypus novemcinctus]XP_058150960.1 uncharacterized protein LOC131278160 [Dasypus novemcinctus]